jgi:hypothetical protein
MARYDDQTYPEVVIDSFATNFNKRFNVEGVERRSLSDWVSEIDRFEFEVREVLENWKPWFERRHEGWIDRAFRGYYESVTHRSMLKACDVCSLYWYENRPVAFVSGNIVGPTQVDLWAAFTTTGVDRRLSRHIIYDVITMCAEKGYHWVNLGGSEEESLHWFKTHLGKHVLIERTHVVYKPSA